MGVWKPNNSPYFYWECQINGDKYGGPTKCTSKRKAKDFFERERQRILKDLRDGPVKKKKRLTLKQASNLFFKEQGQYRTDAGDILNYLLALRDHLGEDTYMDDIVMADLSGMQAVLRGIKTRYGTLPANRTVNAVVPGAIRMLWRYCEDIQDLDLGREPRWAKLTLPTPSERIRELSAEEDIRLFAELRQDYHPFMRFAMMSGLRLNNLTRLTWSEVDMGARVITVKVKSRKPGGKTFMLPITNSMMAVLSQCKGQHAIFVFTYICKRPSGKKLKGRRYPYTKSTFRRPFKVALKAAGIQDFRFHDYRHTAATRTLRASNNLKAVQQMLGHENIQTTAKYAHVLFDDVRAAMDAVDHQSITKITENDADEIDLTTLKKKRKSGRL